MPRSTHTDMNAHTYHTHAHTETHMHTQAALDTQSRAGPCAWMPGQLIVFVLTAGTTPGPATWVRGLDSD